MSKIITIPFTDNFLSPVVDYIYQYSRQQNKDLSRLGIVFGGRRPSLFIKRDLALKLGSAFIPPQFFTIDEWMAYAAYGRQVPAAGQEMDHCYTIYQLTKKHCPWVAQGREGFAQFLPWAREILHFIEQLDLEEVPMDTLKVIQEHAQIGFSVPEDINKLLMHLSTLRQAFHQDLEEKQLAPRGFKYMKASEQVGDCDLDAFDEILFCNFFYLHRTENKVLKNIYDRGKAVLFMQGDQRRWPALSRIAKTFGVPITEGKDVKPTTFNLQIYEAFDAHSQAGLVKGILDKIGKETESTVVVLPDGDFLVPLLTAIGEELGEFNISMGYPLKRSALYTLLTIIAQLQIRRKDNLYYTKDYLGLLRHPLVKNLEINGQRGLVRVLAAKIEEVLKGDILTELSGRLFLNLEHIIRDDKFLDMAANAVSAAEIIISIDEIKKVLQIIHEVFFHSFEHITNAEKLGYALQQFVAFMQANSAIDKYPFNPQIAFSLQEISDELRSSNFAQEIFAPRDLFKILEERLSSQMVAFTGSPLRGLQVLGLFETRALNFKNVIVVDVNEGLLPSLNIYEPLIPREVMIKLNLDRLELEEEIQRYGFMRLISAAAQVHLIYRQNSDRVRSRFIEELVWEQEQRAAKIGTVKITRGAFGVSVEKNKKVIPKTPMMLEYLKDFRFSATSINTYLQNPYAFYCRYILGLKTTDDLLDDPESKHIGIFVHDLLEESFKGFVGKKPVLDLDFKKYFQKIYESKFASIFGRQGRSDTFLMETVLKTRLGLFLEKEAKRCETDVNKVLFIERKFEDILKLEKRDINVTYRVDRVDEMTDGTIMILDYKTGQMDALYRGINKVEGLDLSREFLRDHIKSFQMPLYLHYLHKHFPGKRVNSALYHLRTLSLEPFLKVEEMEQEEQVEHMLELYFKALNFIMDEIFNLEIPFIDDPAELK